MTLVGIELNFFQCDKLVTVIGRNKQEHVYTLRSFAYGFRKKGFKGHCIIWMW